MLLCFSSVMPVDQRGSQNVVTTKKVSHEVIGDLHQFFFRFSLMFLPHFGVFCVIITDSEETHSKKESTCFI